MFIIIDYLISHVSDACQAGTMSEITHLEFYDIISDTFPHGLMQHALAEGSRYVKEYADGLLKFLPKKPVPKQISFRTPKQVTEMHKKSHFKNARKMSTRQKSRKEKPKLNKVQMPTFMLRSTFKELLPEYNDRKQIRVICDSQSLKYMEHIIFAILDDICYHVSETCRTSSVQNMGHLELSEFVKNSFPNDLKQHALAEGSRYVKEYADGNLPEMQYLELSEAVKETFPNDLMQHALAEGSRFVKEYTNGLLKFHPKKPAPEKMSVQHVKQITKKRIPQTNGKYSKLKWAEKKSKPKVRLPTVMFRSVLKEQLSVFTGRRMTGAKFDSHSLKYVEDILFALVENLSSRAFEFCQARGMSVVGQSELSEVIEDTFPNELMRHALAEGSRCIKEFTNDFMNYKHQESTFKQKTYLRNLEGRLPEKSQKRKASFPATIFKKQMKEKSVKEPEQDFDVVMNSYVTDVLDLIVADSVRNAENNIVTSDNIKESMLKIFPGEFASQIYAVAFDNGTQKSESVPQTISSERSLSSLESTTSDTYELAPQEYQGTESSESLPQGMAIEDENSSTSERIPSDSNDLTP
ncbi:hypothetical protein X975_11970, partial [Stegodyphus mimosarum]